MLKYISTLFFCLLSLTAIAETALDVAMPKDAKVCDFVPRTPAGDIKRNGKELRKFQLVHPCPSTGLTTGICPGWAIDHVIPIACGGCDLVVNMQWLPLATKSCKHEYCKDRFERSIQYPDPNIPGLNVKSCLSLILDSKHFIESDVVLIEEVK